MHGQMGYSGIGLVSLIWIGTVAWFVIFSFLVLLRLDRMIKLLEKK